jgi:predicted phage-related endonuclease
MKVIKAVQGSPEWLAARANTRNASEAPAMKGVSLYKSYSDLVREKATGITEEISADKQRLFDKGHAAEDAARPIVEEMIGDSLYPMTATDDFGYLLASSDGATLPAKGGIGYEHKLWNEKLAASVRDGIVPESHAWQLDHTIAVFHFDKMIFVVSDGTPEKFVSCEYRTTNERLASLMAGWKQFDDDVANYQPEVIEAKPILVAKTIDTLPALMIEITGRVTASNLVEFKGHATAVISSINTSLQTDQDFVDATKAAKYLRDVEDNAKRAKANALSQTASIDELFKALDEVIKMAADVRKDLEKKITQEKDIRKQEMVLSAKNELAAYVADLNTMLNGYMQPVTGDFAAVIKGLSSIDSMRSKIGAALAQAKVDAGMIASRIDGNIKSIGDYRFLFPDLHTVCAKNHEDFNALLDSRIAKHKEAEAQRLEVEREKIRKEEQARADREAAAEVAENRAAVEREQAAKFAAELLAASKAAEYPPEAGQKPTSEAGTAPAGAVGVVLAVSSPKLGPTKLDIIDSLLRRLSDSEIDLVLHYCERLLASKEAEAA